MQLKDYSCLCDCNHLYVYTSTFCIPLICLTGYMFLLLQHATPNSLVVLDELGRGTSTFDGYAIAHAVLQHISSKVDCRLLFATHYHPLTTEFAANPRVSLGHMAALVGTSGNASILLVCLQVLCVVAFKHISSMFCVDKACYRLPKCRAHGVGFGITCL